VIAMSDAWLLFWLAREFPPDGDLYLSRLWWTGFTRDHPALAQGKCP
jgi:hypothetical protein